MEKRICQRKKCSIPFTPNKPKQKFCSDKCRVYNSRESNDVSKTHPVASAVKNTPIKPVVAVVVKKEVTGKPKTLDDIKKLCPAKLTGLERSAWISKKRQEVGV